MTNPYQLKPVVALVRGQMATPCQQWQMPFAIAAGITAGSALAAGAAVTVGAVASIVAGTLVAVGIGLTVVGLITGDSSLMKIGGFVGLAGGVVGLGAGLAGSAASTASEIATPAASEVATSASQGGLIGSKQAASAAITPALQSIETPIVSQLPQTATTAANAANITPALASAPTTAGPVASTIAAPQIGGPMPTSLGSDLGTTLAPTQAPTQAGFFDFMESPGFKGAMQLGQLVTPVISGMAGGAYQSDVAEQQLALKEKELGLLGDRNAGQQALADKQFNLTQQQQNYNQMAEERKYQNANTQGRGMLTTRVLSADERLAAAKARAEQAAANARILTGNA